MNTMRHIRYVGMVSYSGGDATRLFDGGFPDGWNQRWIHLKKELLSRGIELTTASQNHANPPDFVIQINVHKRIWNVPTFAVLVECGLICPQNVDYRKLRSYQKIFSWNPELVEEGHAEKIQLAHSLGPSVIDGYANRPKLLVMIAANKSLPVWRPKQDLYRERVRAIRWFERYAPEEFLLYGHGWDKSPRLPTRLGGLVHRIEDRLPLKKTWFPSWRGSIESKQDVLRQTRFSLVYENVGGLRGYITEKIFDAFCAGNVPVYWGAEDIEDFIPETCFIDRRRFRGYPELYEFLHTMPEAQFLAYQRAIYDFLLSEQAQAFSVDRFAETVANGIVSALAVDS